MSNRNPQRTPSPIQRNKDPPQNGRLTYNRGQPRIFTFESYARVAARNLISPSRLASSQVEREKTPNSTESSDWTPQVSHYRPLKRGSAEHSVFYDVTGCANSPQLFYTALSELLCEDQHLGAKFYKENGRSLIEIACDSDATCDLLIESGVTIHDSQIFPIKALDQEAEIVTLQLSDLPFVRKVDLQNNLYEILGKYGEVLDVLLFTDPKNGFFFGNGMAILNRTTPKDIVSAPEFDPDIPYYASLSHNIDYYGKKLFHATWNSMPSYCRYCHSENHVIKDCKERPVLRCWNCDNIGHVRAQCPQKNMTKNRKRPKKQHPAEEFSDSDDDVFEQNLTRLGEQTEKEYQANLQDCENPLVTANDSRNSQNEAETEPIILDNFSGSELSEMEEIQENNESHPKGDDIEMDEPETMSTNQNNSQNVITTETKVTQGNQASKSTTPRTPKPTPVATHKYGTRSKANQAQGDIRGQTLITQRQ